MFKFYLRRPARFPGVKLNAVNVISVQDILDPLAVPVSCFWVGEVDVTGHRAVVVPPRGFWTTIFVED